MSFLGFYRFYRRFIRNYSKITAALTDLTAEPDEGARLRRREEERGLAAQARKALGKRRRKEMLDIGQKGREAMAQLKEAFKEGVIIRHYRPELPIRLETDASDFTIRAVLS